MSPRFSRATLAVSGVAVVLTILSVGTAGFLVGVDVFTPMATGAGYPAWVGLAAAAIAAYVIVACLWTAIGLAVVYGVVRWA